MTLKKRTYTGASELFGIADITMICVCFLWGLGSVINKNALGDDPESFRVFVYSGIRLTAAAIFMFIAAKCFGASMAIRREHWFNFFVLSFFGIFPHFATSMLGLSYTSASNMGVIFATVPFLILILSFFSKIEKPTEALVVGIFIGMLGMIIMSINEASIKFNSGDALVFLSCLFWAVYTVYGKEVLKHYHPMTASAWIFLLASIFHLPLTIYQLPGQEWTRVSPENWFNLIFGTVFALFLSNVLYYYSIKKIGPIRSGLYTNLEPVFTLILANLIRAEIITAEKIAGLLLIFIGIGVTKYPFVKGKPENRVYCGKNTNN